MYSFESIISPFIFIIKQLYLLSYFITGNYGVSILFLSFAISLLLLPIFMFIEKVKRRDDIVIQKMKPVLDEIKKCYKGQERYYYIQTLYRQHNYSSFKALLPILSLLVQIPFFIAAYQFLEHYEPLVGVTFLFIPDLSLPDSIVGGVNVLPVVMTLVNLLTAYFYTRNGNVSERRQMYVVAGAFFILLYNFPSGLVLYWTMNNVFSFLRLFVTNPEVFKKQTLDTENRQLTFSRFQSNYRKIHSKILVTYMVVTIIALLGQINWALMNDFNDIWFRLFVALAASTSLMLLVAISVSSFNVLDKHKDLSFIELIKSQWSRFIPIFIVISSLALLFQVNWAMQHSFTGFPLRVVLAVFLSGVIVFTLAFIVFFYQGFITFKTNFKNFVSFAHKRYFVSFLILFTILLFSQLNWAIHNNFSDFIIRLSVVGFISWFIINFFGNFKWFTQQITVLSFTDIKRYFVKRKRILLVVSLIITSLAIVSQLNWAFHNDFNDIYIRIVLAFPVGLVGSFLLFLFFEIFKFFGSLISKVHVGSGVFYGLYFLTLYFYVASKYYFTGVNTTLSIMSVGFLALFQFIGFTYFFRAAKEVNKWYLLLSMSIVLPLLFFQVLVLFSLLATIPVTFELFGARFLIENSTWLNFTAVGLIVTSITIPFYRRINHGFTLLLPNKHWLIYLLSVLYLTGFVFLWNPLIVYSSSPDVFNFTAQNLLRTNVDLFVISFVSALFLYAILPRRTKQVFLIISISIAAISFVNSSIIPLNMESMQSHRFSNTSNLEAHVGYYLLEALFLILVYSFIHVLIKKRKGKYIVYGLLILVFVPIFQSAFFLVRLNGTTDIESNRLSNIRQPITFSKNEKNVIVLMVDMFQGWYLSKIMDEIPESKEAFNGFVWYPNTVAVSNYTISSIPSIIAGEEYTPHILNKDTVHNLYEKMSLAGRAFNERVKKEGYNFIGTKIPWTGNENKFFDEMFPIWDPAWVHVQESLNIGKSKELSYNVLWKNALFFCSPLSLKSLIYDNGNWLNKEEKSTENTDLTSQYNFLRALPYISNSKGNKPNFIWIWSNATHFPWDIIDDNGHFIANVQPYENNKWSITKIMKWLEWMKKNDVYDNTKIVIVSDHGIRSQKPNDAFIFNPFVSTNTDKISKEVLLAFTPLMMVKDFNSHGSIKIDHRLLSIADVPSIALSQSDPTKEEKPKTREIRASYLSWNIKYKATRYPIEGHYLIKKNIFDVDNWTVLKAE